MTARLTAPDGAPCWTDLWTSDVEGSKRFYGELFGWEADEPNPEFGGYFTFRRDGVWIAGAMGDMGAPGSDFYMPANDTWKIYLATPDLAASVAVVADAGGTVINPPMAVGDLGSMTVLEDPVGATVGLWQANTHQGFLVLDEPAAPGWFELHTRSHAAAVTFYAAITGLRTQLVSDTDEFRYTTLHLASGDQVAGIMDATSWLPGDAPAYWTTYWTVDDADAATGTVTRLGGTVIAPAEDTPYGRIATVADPCGATFRLRTA